MIWIKSLEKLKDCGKVIDISDKKHTQKLHR